jgi:hypothetical protein
VSSHCHCTTRSRSALACNKNGQEEKKEQEGRGPDSNEEAEEPKGGSDQESTQGGSRTAQQCNAAPFFCRSTPELLGRYARHVSPIEEARAQSPIGHPGSKGLRRTFPCAGQTWSSPFLCVSLFLFPFRPWPIYCCSTVVRKRLSCFCVSTVLPPPPIASLIPRLSLSLLDCFFNCSPVPLFPPVVSLLPFYCLSIEVMSTVVWSTVIRTNG